MRFNDALSGAVFMLLALWLIVTAASFPTLPGQPYGAALLPRVVGAGFAICGLLLVLRGLSAAGRRRPLLELDAALHTPRNAVSLLLLVGGVVFYILCADWAGFIPVAFLLLMVLFLWFRVRPLNALVIAALFTGVTFWFFAYLLRVPLPRGWLTGIV